MAAPLAYVISWTCYGQWMHGDDRGSVDPRHNILGEPWLQPDADRKESESYDQSQPSYEMDEARRIVVLDALRGVCDYRKWTLHAVHIRSNHIHVVVTADRPPERVTNDFKSYSSRALSEAGFDDPDRKRWTRHGSTKYINDESYLRAAINYVLNKQGIPQQCWPES